MTATTTAPAVESNLALEFLVTKEHRRFVEFAAAVREHRYIGVCYGPPGVGKTVSARRYTDWDRLGPWLEGDRFGHVDAPDDAHAVLYTPTTFVTARQLDEDLGTLCWTLGYAIHRRRDDPARPASPEQNVQLVIVAEADRLKTSTLEQLRDFFDRRALGLILIGMPGLEKRLARYPQLYSRVGSHTNAGRSAPRSCATSSRITGNASASPSTPATTPTPKRSPPLRAPPTATSGSPTACSRRSPGSWRSTTSRRSLPRSSTPPARPSSSASPDGHQALPEPGQLSLRITRRRTLMAGAWERTPPRRDCDREVERCKDQTDEGDEDHLAGYASELRRLAGFHARRGWPGRWVR